MVYRYKTTYISKNQILICIFYIIFILKIKYIESFTPFKAISLLNNNYLIITYDKISFYNNDYNSITEIYPFSNNQIISSEEELEMIYFGRFPQEGTPNLLIVKNFAYAIGEDGFFSCVQELTEIADYYNSFIIPIKCTLSKCYYLIGVTNLNKKLYLYLYSNIGFECETSFMTYANIDSDSDNISCQLTDSSFDQLVKLICFYEKYNSKEIKSTIFNIDLIFGTIQEISSISQTNNGGKIIKSYLSEDKLKSLVCFINDDNNCNCLKYNIISGQWNSNNNVNNILKNCLPNLYTLNLEYNSNINKYLLSCEMPSNKYNLVKLNNNFEIINDDSNDNGNNIYQIDENEFNNCNEYLISSSLFIDNNNNIKFLVNCDNNILKYDIQKAPIETTEITESSFPIISTFVSFEKEVIVIQENCNKTKEEILNNLNNFMENYDIDKIYEIFGNDYQIKISPLKEKTYKNISTYINLTNCENIFRQKSEISISNLSLFQIEIYNTYQNSLINEVEYAVFNEEKEIVDLAICKDEKIEINYEIKNNSLINISKVNYYQEQGIDIFNIQDKFFNDICYSYSEEDSDIILKDRISDIYENVSLCEDDCIYEGINVTLNTVICECSVKNYNNDTKSESKELKINEVIFNTFTDSNIGVIKCYNLVFNIKSKFQNIGFWIFSFLVLIHIPIFIYYFINTINPIKKFIYEEINKFGYTINSLNPIKNNKKSKNKKIENFKKINNDDLISYNKEISVKDKLKDNITNTIVISNNLSSSKIPNLESKRFNMSNRDIIKVEKNKNQNEKHKNSRFKNNEINKDKNKNKNIFGSSNKHNTDKSNKIKFSPNIYFLIQMDANNTTSIKPPNSYIILDNYQYDTAIKYEKRNFFRIFYICMLAKDNIINLICFKNPLNLRILKLCLFIFVFSSDLAFTTIFYSNDNISDKYHYEGDNIYYFTIINNMVQSLSSSIVSLVLVDIFQYLIDSRGKYEDIFREEEKKMRENRKYKVDRKTKIEILKKINNISIKLKYKIIIFFTCEFSIMIFFYYFVTAFCEVYKKTQISWILDFLVSFLLSFLAEIFCSWLLAIFYILSIRYKLKFLYVIVLIIYNL